MYGPRKLLSGVLAAGVAMVASVSFAAPAIAADGNDPVIRKVDSSNMPNVVLNVLRPPSSSSDTDVKISENGSPITNAKIQTAAEAGLPMAVALVMDTSQDASGTLSQQKAAAIEFIAGKPANQAVAIVATNGEPRTVAGFTTDGAVLTNIINSLNASNQNALWKGVSLAGRLLQDQGNLQHNLIVMSASEDKLSVDGAFTSAQALVSNTKTVVFTVGIGDESKINAGDLQSLAAKSGGRYITATEATSLPRILTGLQKNLSDQAIISYSSSATTSIEVTVAIGSGTATARTATNSISEGADVNPVVVPQNSGPSFLSGTVGLIIIAIVALLAVGLLLYGLIEVLGKERNQLTSALRPYSDEPAEVRDISRLADSEIIKKAVAAVGKSAEDRGLMTVIERRLEQADLPFRPAEALFIWVISTLVVMLIGALLFSIFGIIIGGLIGMLPLFVTGFLAKRRKNKFTRQLPDTLQLMAGSLRAGYSMVQGLDAVAKQSDAPMGPELNRAMAEARLGRPVEEALQEISDRMGSDDFEWAVMAIKIQREVGGNLAELLMTVSETMIARERLRREVRALTAEGRISAIVLAGLPPIIAIVIAVINPGYMAPMFDNLIGQVALGAGALMIVVGYWLMMKMIKVEA